MIAEIRNKLDKYLNNLKIKKKLFLLYFYCVMLPLVLTDAVILGITIRDEYDAKQEMLRNAVSSVMYNLNSAVENAVTISKISILTNISMNS